MTSDIYFSSFREYRILVLYIEFMSLGVFLRKGLIRLMSTDIFPIIRKMIRLERNFNFQGPLTKSD